MSIHIEPGLYLGMQEAFSKTITEADTALYIGLTGDKCSQLEVHPGPSLSPFFLVGIIGGLLNTEMPGEGSQCITVKYEFLAPIFCGDRIDIIIELTELDSDKHLATFRIDCNNQDKNQVLVGQAVMLVSARILS